MKDKNSLISMDKYNGHDNTMKIKKQLNKSRKDYNEITIKLNEKKRKHEIERPSVLLNSDSDDGNKEKTSVLLNSDSDDDDFMADTSVQLGSDSDEGGNIKNTSVLLDSDSDDDNIEETNVKQDGNKHITTYKFKKINNPDGKCNVMTVFKNYTDCTLFDNNKKNTIKTYDLSKTNIKDGYNDVVEHGNCLQKNNKNLHNRYAKKRRNINECNIASGSNHLVVDGGEYILSTNDDNGSKIKEQKSVIIDSESDHDCSIKEKKRLVKINHCRNGDVNTGEMVNNHQSVNDSDQSHTSRMALIDEDYLTPLYHVQAKDRRQCLDQLKEKGIMTKSGKWDTEEIQQMEKNMKEFLEQFPVKDFSRLIIPRTQEERVFRRKNKFLLSMCRGIRRSIIDVTQRVEIQFSSFLSKGKYSEKERRELKKLHILHGNKWQKIGVIMNRSRFSLPTIRTSINNESWSEEEDKYLKKAVTGYLDRQEKIFWPTIAKLVGTRNYRQCHQRWLTKDFHSHQNVQYNDIVFEDKDIFKLLKIIMESNIDDFYLLDWNDLSKHFNNKITPNWLKWKFGVISKEVPHSYTMEFDELIEQIYNIYERKIHSGNNVDPILMEDITSDVEETSFDGVMIID